MLKPVYAVVDLKTAYPLANNFTSFGDLFSVVLKNVYVLVGLVFLFILILSGLSYILSAGNKEKTQKAAAGITNAILGLVVVFGSYWIIQIAELITGVDILGK